MYRSRPATVRKGSTGGGNSKIPATKLNSDTVYLMQNQNQILKTKNLELDNKIDSLKIELHERNYRVSQSEKDCQYLRQSINQSLYTKDIQLESQRKALIERVALNQSNLKIYQTKINDARKAVVLEQEKMIQYIEDKKRYQEQLRIIKMDNQGSKSILKNLQDQNQQLREFNAKLSLKKFTYEPEQKMITTQIQERIRLIKNINSSSNQFKKQQSGKIIYWLLQSMIIRKQKVDLMQIERYGLKKAIMKKKLYLMAYIRKKYVDTIKTKVLSSFRASFKPLQEQKKCQQIIKLMNNRRSKAKIWRIWRNQTAKAEYALIRKFQCQNSIQKVCQTVMKAQLYSAFSVLKYYKNHHFQKIGCDKIYNSLQKLYLKKVNSLISQFKYQNHKYQLERQIQESAKQHSQILGIGMFFGAWAKHTKIQKTVNYLRKYRYFKELNKLRTLKKKNKLVQMLGKMNNRIYEANKLSQFFTELKRQYIQEKLSKLNQEKNKFETKVAQTRQNIQNLHLNDQISSKNRAMIKISQYLKKKTQQAFNIWRKQNKKMFGLRIVFQLMINKQTNIVNFAFTRIQKKRFQKLKLSIKDKIASCEYSYNYLVQENTHIKEVLQTKSHELEKAKFTAILKRIIRREKQVKQKYFYKFMRNGFKCWQVKKALLRADGLMCKKIKLVLFFLLKQNKIQAIHQDKINYFTNRHDQKQINDLCKKAFDTFKKQTERNKRLKRAIGGIFDRNLQIAYYQAFGKVRNQGYQSQIKQLDDHQEKLNLDITETNNVISETQESIQVLTNRLKYKQKTLKQRKTMSLYKFFSKNVKNYVGTYIWRWKNKIDQEKRILRFVEIVDTKSKSMIKTKFLLAIQKSKGQVQKNDLEKRFVKFKGQYEKANIQLDKFSTQAQLKSSKMKEENQENVRIAEQYQQKTQHMNQVKVQSFLKYWGKTFSKFVFKQWKQRKLIFRQKWNHIFSILETSVLRGSFETMSSQLKYEIVRSRIRANLRKIDHKIYCYNVGVGFKKYRNIVLARKIELNQIQLKKKMKGMEHIEKHYLMVKNKFIPRVDIRFQKIKLSQITNRWRQYTLVKLKNNQKKNKLDKYLLKGFSIDMIRVLNRNKQIQQKIKQKIANFKLNIVKAEAKKFMEILFDIKCKKYSIKKLFIEKFCFYEINKLNQVFFTKVKNYYRNKEINQKDQKCFKIQKVIETFQKKRKDILCQNMRIWRRNQFLINIQKNVLKRVTRKAMNYKVQELFYAWKLQRQARYVLYENTQQGQIKKRKIQIKRLQRFLEDYKKQKGLLLQNEEGNFVVSPKFQQKKQQQLKKDNILKYRFVSRLVLAMNGYQAPIKAWNNLQVYMKIRCQYRKAALMTKNRLQKPDLYNAFKIWQNGTRQLRNTFENMQRKDLVKILNRQKDKMQMQYSKKVDIQDKVQTQLRRYKVLSYQQKRKQRICAQILFRQARKVKSYAFDSWKKSVDEMRQHQALVLEQRGNQKIMNMEQDVNELQAYERQLKEQNQALQQAVSQAIEIADMVKRISDQRNLIRKELTENDISCQNLQQENEELNNKLIQAQKEAMHLLMLSGQQI